MENESNTYTKVERYGDYIVLETEKVKVEVLGVECRLTKKFPNADKITELLEKIKEKE
jgi:hypothetical protein